MPDFEANAPQTTSDPLGLKPGEIFWNNYRVISVVGKGGVSTVYKAEHVQNKQLVAIKVLHSHKTRDEELVRRFVREAQTTSRLDHPHAIKIYEWGIDKYERPFMIIEFLSGETLARRIQRCNGLNYQKAVEIMEQICDAVGEAHSLGIIHRDLKPENVMLITHNGIEDFVKVVDFGIAKMVEPTDEQAVGQAALTKTGAILGTPLYMSPEQLRGRKADARSDIYSLGVVMYEMLTGKPPFYSKNAAEVVVGHLNQTPEQPSKVRMDLNIPPALDEPVLRALAKNPWERPTTVQEFSHSLVKGAGKRGEPVRPLVQAAAPAPSPASVPERQSRQTPFAASPPHTPAGTVTTTPPKGTTIDPVRRVCPNCKTVSSGTNFRYCLKCGQDNTNRWLPYHKKTKVKGAAGLLAGRQARRIFLLIVLAGVLAWATNSYLSAPIELTGKFTGTLDKELFASRDINPALAKKLRLGKLTLLLSQHDEDISGLLTTRFGQSSVVGKVVKVSPLLLSYELSSSVHALDGRLDVEMVGTFDKVMRSNDWTVKAFYQGPRTRPLTEITGMKFSRLDDEGQKTEK